MKLFEVEDIYLPSLILLRDLFTEFEGRGLIVNEFSLKIKSFIGKKEEFIVVKDFTTFKSVLNEYISYNKDQIGYKAAIIQDCYLINSNLNRYQNEFRIDARNLLAPKFRDIKIKHKEQQPVIDREIERYKQFIISILNDYRVAYRINIEKILNDLNDSNSNSYVNYVKINYMSPGYVTPQQ